MHNLDAIGLQCLHGSLPIHSLQAEGDDSIVGLLPPEHAQRVDVATQGRNTVRNPRQTTHFLRDNDRDTQ